MAGLLDDEASPIDHLIALAQAAGSFRGTPMDAAYHQALLRASHNALAAAPKGSEPMGANMLLSPMLAKLQQGGPMSGAQAFYAQTPAGGSGFGSGLAYKNEDIGKNL